MTDCCEHTCKSKFSVFKKIRLDSATPSQPPPPKNVAMVVASHCVAQNSGRAVVSRLEVILGRMLKNLLFCIMDSTVRQTIKSCQVIF